MIEKSADISEIAKALLAFQAQATGVVKDSKNPHFKNRYASLEAVVDEQAVWLTHQQTMHGDKLPTPVRQPLFRHRVETVTADYRIPAEPTDQMDIRDVDFRFLSLS